MTKIYIRGCNCGVTNIQTARVKAKHANTQVFNTRVDPERLAEHEAFIKEAGIESTLTPIIVSDEGEITRLKEWKP